MMQNMGFNAFNVREKKNSDIPRLSVGFGSLNQVPSRLRIISRSAWLVVLGGHGEMA